MKHSHATLADVARTAGVGVATASRVINGGVNVSPQTLKRVEAAVRKLGYLPNHAARILRGGRTKTIGLLVPSIADPFFSSCAESAEEVARAHDSLLIVAVSKNEPAIEMANLAVLMRHRPDGLLIVPSSPKNRRLREFAAQSTIPIVTLDRPLPGCPSVLTDSFAGAREATRHLLAHGRKRILCLAADPELYTIAERLRGYTEAMKEAGLKPLVDTTLESGVDATEARLRVHFARKLPPDAVFTLKNSVTAATYQALQQLKIAIPASAALIGFDDFAMASTLRPAVSVVQQPIQEVGRRAAEILFSFIDRSDGERHAADLQAPVVLRNELLLRDSCGCGMERL